MAGDPGSSDFLWNVVAFANFMRLSILKGARAASSSAARQEIRVREMAKKCVVSVLIRVRRRFFGFGGFFFHQLLVMVIDGGPEDGGATAARDETRRSYSERAEFFEGLVDRGAISLWPCANNGLQGVLGRGRLLLVEKRLWRTMGWEWEWEWFRGGERRDWPRSRVGVSRTGCVPGREVYLGKQLFPLLFYLCEGRRAGPGYAHPQVSYQHSPRLRLRVSDVSFHRKRAVPWRDDPPGCLACMHRDLASGCTPGDVGLWALRYVLPGCTTALYP